MCNFYEPNPDVSTSYCMNFAVFYFSEQATQILQMASTRKVPFQVFCQVFTLRL